MFAEQLMLNYKNLFPLFLLLNLFSCGGGGGTSPAPEPVTPIEYPKHPLIWDVATPESVGMNTSKLNQAFDYAFQDGTFTQAAVVIKDGKLIYERYRGILDGEKSTLSNATGIDQSSLEALYGNKNVYSYVTSWSSSKSFVSFLIGIAQENKLITSINDSASIFIQEWANDERSSITIKNLLDMRSGLDPICFNKDLGELDTCKNTSDSSSGGDLVYSDDQLSKCINRELAESGVIQFWYSDTNIYNRGDFKYSNCDTQVLGEILFRATGQDIQTFAEYQLFSKIGINAVWWKDFIDNGQVNGNYLAYCCLDSTARDYAKFGHMLLLGGIWEGNNLSYESYVNNIKSLNYYGLQFWKLCSRPLDENYNCPQQDWITSTIGFDGQYIMVDFNRNIVVVRSSLYEPVLNISNDRKMKLVSNDLTISNWASSIPSGLGVDASSSTSFSANLFYYLVTEAID